VFRTERGRDLRVVDHLTCKYGSVFLGESRSGNWGRDLMVMLHRELSGEKSCLRSAQAGGELKIRQIIQIQVE